VRLRIVDLRGRVVAEMSAAPSGGVAVAAWDPDPSRHPAGAYVLMLPDRPDAEPVRISLIR
jgi:hypothetical protein